MSTGETVDHFAKARHRLRVFRHDRYLFGSHVLKQTNPDVIVSFGGGSTIDTTKAAEVVRTLGGEIDECFGTGLFTTRLRRTPGKSTPHVAIQTAASSAALHGRDLGLAAAQAMSAFAEAIDFPTTLGDVQGFAEAHIDRALTAARDPQFAVKLQNRPIPPTAGMVDECMGPVLQAARTGDLRIIRNG